jgi:hypothetical protein
MIRTALGALEKEASRRAFLHNLVKGAGLVAAYDRFGTELFADAPRPLPYQVYSAIGNVIIPVDQDPGWATFEPGITNFGVDVFVRQLLLGGSFLAFEGFLATLSALNQIPVLTTYGPAFLSMAPTAQNQYFSDLLTGKFENDGFGDVAGFSSGLALISTKGTFFSNYPNHQAYPGQEFQVRKPIGVKTGFDIMQLRGPVGPDEEKQLRTRFFDVEELPGVDPTNRYI